MKRVSIKRDIYVYLFGFLISLTTIYALMINKSYEVGLEESAKYSFLYELKLAEKQYLTRGGLQSSYRLSFQVFDDFNKIPIAYRNLFDWSHFEPGRIHEKYVSGETQQLGHYYYATTHHMSRTNTYLYIVSEYDESTYYQLYEQSPPESVNKVNSAFLLIGGLLLLVFILIRLLVYRLTQPIIKLSKWSQSLALDDSAKLHYFRYTEVQQLADQLLDSVRSQRQAIEREEFFLRAASHELRTPVATISVSGEMLTRLSDTMTAGGQRAVARINRSVITMQNLITALLWMSRNQKLNIEISQIDIKSVVDEALLHHRYLAQEKNLEIILITNELNIFPPMPLVLVEIVITNLVRNALQHAAEGVVEIAISAFSISISNTINGAETANSDTSFGIGIMLIERLCAHQGWRLSHQTKKNQYVAKVDFINSPSL